MRTSCVAAFGFFLLAAPASSQTAWFSKPLSDRIANYQIEARLLPDEKMVIGSEILTWRNATSNPVSTLQFHLYMNAFRNSESTFMRELPYPSRYRKRKPEDWGWIEVDSLRWGGVDLLGGARFIQPDDGNPHDRTVLEVPLPRRVGPGESIQLSISFRVKLPRIIARTGYLDDDFFFVAQWFPKIGVLQNDGWNCHQFHRNSEFFADFGVYDVAITVPPKFVVGATGTVVSETLSDSTRTVHFHAEDVHDFAWTASPHYEVAIDSLGAMEIRLLIQKKHRSLARRHLEAARLSLEHFQREVGEYPYPVLTVVDTKGRAGGMEYPTLITAGVLFGPYAPRGLRAIEAVIIHEFGHQYWYGMVASNEFEEAWLDEGINSYWEARIFEEAFGECGNLIDFLGIRLNDLEMQRWQLQAVRSPDPMLRRAWEFVNPQSYSVNSYAKAAVTLSTLERLVGEKTWLDVMRTYFERWRFRHPTTQDFLAVLEEKNLRPEYVDFLREVLEKPGYVDYGIAWVASFKKRQPIGTDFDSLRETGADSLPTDSASTDSIRYWNQVLVRRYGRIRIPVDILLRFQDGDSLLFTWDGRDTWHRIEVESASRLLWAAVDPQDKVVADLNLLNNSRTTEPRMRGVRKLFTRWMYWLQAIFATISFFS